MDLDTILSDPQSALGHLERYVNDGSPSGFTALHRTSSLTDPFGDQTSFAPYVLFDSEASFSTFGALVSHNILKNNLMFIHPDMAHHPDLSGYDVSECDDLRVVPTSSARTVQIINHFPNDYIKLYYDGIVGRHNRRLYRTKAIAGPEISGLLLSAIDLHQLPDYLAILHEPCARIHRNRNHEDPGNDWGMVWRESHPRGTAANRVHWIAPLFSLWSKDRLNPGQPTLLEQLSELWMHRAEEHILTLLRNIIDIHFTLVSKLGLQFEFNAQNVLLGFDDECQIVTVILRDMMDVEKDIAIRHSLNLPLDFASYPYHVLSESDKLFAQKRRSFAFDFKLCKYIVSPLLTNGHLYGASSFERILSDLKAHTSTWIKRLPAEYFPQNGLWYAYARVLVDTNKVLIANQEPLLR